MNRYVRKDVVAKTYLKSPVWGNLLLTTDGKIWKEIGESGDYEQMCFEQLSMEIRQKEEAAAKLLDDARDLKQFLRSREIPVTIYGS